MLVISRKPGERIVVGNGVEIMVLQICGNKVRLGVTVPRGVSVERVEMPSWTPESRPEPRDFAPFSIDRLNHTRTTGDDRKMPHATDRPLATP